MGTQAGPIFLNSSGLIALIHRGDALHERAKKCYASLGRRKRVTTVAVLIECLNFLSRAPLRPLAVALWEQIQNAVMIGVLEVVPLSEELFAEGLTLFLSRPDKEWSLTDCISFVVMEKRGIRQAFTADKHFAQAGFEALLL
ncbi:PIN domain-containing protein [Fervidibacter sacchari]|jgi:Predicted nucleic acid-binding protein, contains PIN domain|uniref:Nucleic acid-binding protein n=1 Tax=Candidatus Fervidibacter sacchari TaxID=1448929 RepID=A0ABT2EQS4_9BACT|nr:PIN domain-containing protein [Candidatus Fervidibacter sacchari]MCS3920267.1 putative nucleic acid-binding protein [Candidatus Fervidibacter sacchari]WKU14767.1 PIN domain-containing protein [Candidatus Fervidibacter sacchari]